MKILIIGLITVSIFTLSTMAQNPIGEPGKGDKGPNPLKNVYCSED